MMFAPPAGLAQLTFAALTVPRIADWFSIVLTGMGLYLVTVLTFIRTITEFDKGKLSGWNDVLGTATGSSGYATHVHPLAGYWIWIAAAVIAMVGAWILSD